MPQQVVHITTTELADELRVDASTIRRWVDSGRLIPAITTPGGHHRFIREDALAALAPKRHQTTGALAASPSAVAAPTAPSAPVSTEGAPRRGDAPSSSHGDA